MASNMYIKFEEPAIDASSTAAGHEKEIEILSWSHGFVQPTSPTRSFAGSGSVEQATHQNLTFTKYLDTELPAPAGQGLLRRQRRPSLIDLKGAGLYHWSLLNAAGCIAPPRGQPVA